MITNRSIVRMNELVATREGLDIAHVRSHERDAEDMVAHDENDSLIVATSSSSI